MRRRLTLSVILAALGASAAATGQTDVIDSVKKKHIRRIVVWEANPPRGQPLLTPEAVWRKQERYFRDDLQLTVEELRELLVSEDLKTRALSAHLLGQVSGWWVRRSLQAAAAQDPESKVRMAALEGLRAASAFPELCGVLREFGDRFEDEKLEGSDSSIEAIRKARALLGTSEVIRLEAPPQPPPPFFPQEGQGVMDFVKAVRVVAEAIEEITDAGSGQVYEGKVLLGRPWRGDDPTDRIWSLGPVAIRPLTHRAWAGAGSEWAIARRLLLDVGGPALIAPMSEIVLTHPEAHVRLTAMEALLYAGGFFEIWDLLQERMEAEKDPAVRARAIAYRNACLTAGKAASSEAGIP